MEDAQISPNRQGLLEGKSLFPLPSTAYPSRRPLDMLPRLWIWTPAERSSSAFYPLSGQSAAARRIIPLISEILILGCHLRALSGRNIAMTAVRRLIRPMV